MGTAIKDTSQFEKRRLDFPMRMHHSAIIPIKQDLVAATVA